MVRRTHHAGIITPESKESHDWRGTLASRESVQVSSHQERVLVGVGIVAATLADHRETLCLIQEDGGVVRFPDLQISDAAARLASLRQGAREQHPSDPTP